jgi:hypothetical protein
MLTRLLLHTLLAAALVAAASFAWQARGEGTAATAASLGYVLGLGEDDGGDTP